MLLEPRKFASASALGMLSPTGRCHAFDVAAEMAEEGVLAEELAISCKQVCTRRGIDWKGVLN